MDASIKSYILLLLSLNSFSASSAVCWNSTGISCDPNDVKFYLYPNSANSSDFDELVYGNMSSIDGSRFDASKKTILLTHGFIQNFQADFPVVLVKAYLDNGFTSSSNIITVDWGKLSGATAPTFPFALATTLAQLPQYVAVVQNVPVVGERIADFLVFLAGNNKTSADKVHLIGQSLGAHVSGHAGTEFKKQTNTLINRITGTDPAGPLFYPFPLVPLIGPNVASFVDIVHTNRGMHGYPLNLGHVDFNVNGGGPLQPGCFNISDKFCAHNSAPHYYARSIAATNLLGTKECLFCRTEKAIFGEFCPPETSGLFNINLPNGNSFFGSGSATA